MRRTLMILNVAVVAAFALLDIAGMRQHAGFLVGASTDGFLAGPAYVMLWFALVLWVPITTLAVILDLGYGRLLNRWRLTRRP
jgi:hypothetical protein